MISPRFTVVMTVRNGERHLNCALSSVLRQELSDWEMVCFSDGSADQTIEIGNSYATRDRRVKFIESGPIGRAAALNAAVMLSTGERIVVLDADDALHPQCLARYSECLDYKSRGNMDMTILGSGTGIVFDDQEPAWRLPPQSSTLKDVTQLLARCNPLAHSGVCYSRQVFQLVGGYSLMQGGALDYRFYVDAVRAGAVLLRHDAILCAKRIHSMQSFERGKRFQYLKWGLKTQLYASEVLNKGRGHRLLAYIRFAYGFLPRALRLYRYRRLTLCVA